MNIMKLLRITSAVLSIVLFSSVSQSAGFLKIEGIKGEATDKNHQGWIDILSVSGLSDQGEAREKGSGLATGKRQHKPISITKPIDKATPLLARSSSGDGFPSELTISENGTNYHLKGVKVRSVRRMGKNEVLTISYTDLETTRTRARDYNSSRSNTTSRALRAAPANHNTTRSNRLSP